MRVTAGARPGSDLVALAELVSGLRFLQQVRAFMVAHMRSKIAVYEDKEGGMKMATSRCSRRRTRHIDVDHNIVRDDVDEVAIKINYVKSGDQHADALIKALDMKTFEKHRTFLLNVRV